MADARSGKHVVVQTDADSTDTRFPVLIADKGECSDLDASDAFNVLNHVNYVSFIGKLSSPFFEKAVAAGPPRRLQLSARFKF